MDNFDEIISALKSGNFNYLREYLRNMMQTNPNDEDTKLLTLIFQPLETMVYQTESKIRKPDSLFVEVINPKEKVKSIFIAESEATKIKETKAEGKPKVVHLCVWDEGGAATAALRLHFGLLNRGIDSKFLVLYKKNKYPEVFTLKRKEIAKNWKWDEYYRLWNDFLYKKYPQRPKDLEIFTGIEGIADLKSDENIRNADIINFHWVSSIVDFREDIEVFRGKKIAWTMHDENPFTGGCHYTSSCEKFENKCSKCPQLNSHSEMDLSSYQFEIKKRFYDELDITLVAPSNWLAEKTKKSKLLGNKTVYVIPYGFPIGIFHYYEPEKIREYFKIPFNSFVILFGAAYSNKRKGFHFFHEIVKRFPEKINGKPVEIYIFGNTGNLHLQSRVPVKHFGNIENPFVLAMAYSMADVFLSLSMEDNLPNTCIESICCGTPVVAFEVGGIPDIVKHKENGWLAKPFELEQILEGINFWGEQEKIDKHGISLEAQKRFNSDLQARNYENLYKSLLNNDGSFKKEDIDNEFHDLNAYLENSKFFLPTQSVLSHFSGLDVHHLRKIINTKNVSLDDFFNMFINKFCLSNKKLSYSILLILDSESLILLKLPTIIYLNLILLEFYSQNKFSFSQVSENSVLRISYDNFDDAFNNFQFELGFGFISYDSLINNNIDILDFLEKIQSNLRKHSRLILFFETQLQNLDQIINDTKLFFKKHLDENANFDLLSTNSSFTDKLLTFEHNNQKKVLVGIILNGQSKLNLYTEKIIRTPRKNLLYPRISIVTPNYNGGEFLDECIDSILSQNYSNLEYIIIDGGSNDNSLEIIKKYEKYLTSWVSEPDRGQYDAINKGFARTTGDIMAWLNSDDLYFPGAFFFIADFFASFNDFLWVTNGIFTHFSYDGELIVNTKNKFYSYSKYLNNEWNHPYIMQESTFWRRELWEKAGGKLDINYDYAGDMELWCRFFRLTTPAVLNIPIAVFRFNPKQKTATNFDRYETQAKQLVLREQNFVKRNKITNFPISKPISFEKFIEHSGLKLTLPELERIVKNYKKFISTRKTANHAKNVFESLIEDFETIIKNVYEKDQVIK